MVLGGRLGGRTEPGRAGFVLSQPGTGGGEVEYLDDLGAEAPGEPGRPADGVLAGDPTCLCAVVPSGR